MRSVWKRRFIATTITDGGKPAFNHVLDRQFDVEQLSDDNANSQPVGRAEMNGILSEVIEGLGEM